MSLDVTNTGPRYGATVVQVYLSDPKSSLPRPPKELKAFSKVQLASGGTQRVILELTARDFAYFNPASTEWVVEEGEYLVRVASSSSEIVASLPVSRLTALSLPV